MASYTDTKGVEGEGYWSMGCDAVYGLGCVDDVQWFMVYGLWFMVYGLWYMVYGLWFMVYDYVHCSAACHACAVTRLACYVAALPYLKGACRGCSQEVCGAAGHYLCFARFAALLHYCYTRAPCDCDNHERSQRKHLAFTPWAVQRMPTLQHHTSRARWRSLQLIALHRPITMLLRCIPHLPHLSRPFLLILILTLLELPFSPHPHPNAA